MGTYRDLNDYELMYMVEENDDAKELLFDKYKPIVKKMASKYRLEASKVGLEVEDLIQEGYIGLISAIKNYNPDDDALFYTYAVISIKSKLLNCIRMSSCKKHYCLNQSISLSKPISVDSDLIILDFIEDTNTEIPDLVVYENQISSLLKDSLYNLEIIAAGIFELTMNGFSNGDIAILLGVSNKTVYNYLFKIRKKIRKSLDLFN